MDAYFYIILVVGLVSTRHLPDRRHPQKGAERHDDPLGGRRRTVPAGVPGRFDRPGGSGEPIAGEPWEFWGYLLTALLLPVGAVYWAILERTRWSNFVLAAVGVTALVMAARMNQIWY